MGASSGPYFPVLKQPLQTFFKEYAARFLLVDRGYVDPKDLDLLPFEFLFEEGSYQLYRYREM
ncbi:MAG: hypothetical protein ACE5FB_03890 [Candidatus Binatia bacterium]